jgi:ABC-type spermidine/putrescine transport system permease subunit I
MQFASFLKILLVGFVDTYQKLFKKTFVLALILTIICFLLAALLAAYTDFSALSKFKVSQHIKLFFHTIQLRR